MTTYQIDAANQSLGRVASEAAQALRGKHLPSFEPSKLPTIEVVITNIDKIKFTGQKMDQKVYYHYSGYHGGMKERKLSILWESKPKEVVRMAIYRMLPKNKSRDKIIKNLKIK
jgi:large subunit ribosomal protein L13